jgi:hypothetical protein
MAIIDTIENAETALKRKVAWDAEPALTDGGSGELQGILGDNVVATIWEAETEYKLGDRVIPTEENRVGRMFKCVGHGTSGEEEPDWDGLIIGGTPGRSLLGDGDVLWVEDGLETDLWDIDEAAREAWQAKAGKASDQISVNRGGNNYDLNAIYTHCIEMADRFGGKFII